MIETKTRDIKGLQVTSAQLPAMRAYGVFTRLGVILGPALASLGELDVKSLDSEVEQLGPAVGALLGGLSQDVPLVLALLQSTSVVVEGKRIELNDEAKINHAFSGKFLALLLTLKFAVEVNFADFLDAGRAAIEAREDKAETDPK